MKKLTMGEIVEVVARAAHEANRAYCLAHGDTSQPPWESAAEWARTSARTGAQAVINGNRSSEYSHELWMKEKAADGWKYGPLKDPSKKEHPCMVSYRDLPKEQRLKDDLFIKVCDAMAGVLFPFWEHNAAFARESVREALQEQAPDSE